MCLLVLYSRGDTPYNGLYGEAPPERVEISRVEVDERVGKSERVLYCFNTYVRSGTYTKRVPFVNGRYTKGVSFLPKMIYKRVRGRTFGRSLPVLIFF